MSTLSRRLQELREVARETTALDFAGSIEPWTCSASGRLEQLICEVNRSRMEFSRVVECDFVDLMSVFIGLPKTACRIAGDQSSSCRNEERLRHVSMWQMRTGPQYFARLSTCLASNTVAARRSNDRGNSTSASCIRVVPMLRAVATWTTPFL